jgi:hypothetical protein
MSLRSIACGLLLLLAIPATARPTHSKKPAGRIFVPSSQNLLEQNAELNRLGLGRYENDRALSAAIERGELVPIVSGPTLVMDKHVPAARRYARPWVVSFLQELAADYYARFGLPLKVNSAVRTLQFQKRLRRWNANAAPVQGQYASVHTAGLAVDLQRRGLSKAQLRFLQMRLLYHYARGAVLVEEEVRRNSCFHVVVRGSYAEVETITANLPSYMLVPIPELSAEGMLDFPPN